MPHDTRNEQRNSQLLMISCYAE